MSEQNDFFYFTADSDDEDFIELYQGEYDREKKKWKIPIVHKDKLIKKRIFRSKSFDQTADSDDSQEEEFVRKKISKKRQKKKIIKIKKEIEKKSDHSDQS
jgi:hypothetical protein